MSRVRTVRSSPSMVREKRVSCVVVFMEHADHIHAPMRSLWQLSFRIFRYPDQGSLSGASQDEAVDTDQSIYISSFIIINRHYYLSTILI